ncbi:hypothetical protein [Alkaliphilus peptidifermentans]|uniref:Uncharacterized protein n=1 Tax=Alkaliphilus peptidifermentans DSM 18978 TaxID=1120976 RepID=A0A1G5KQP4_9FIRM|nr:hypothetical protein [Alkaliphilus peptidifermentans]SCZ02993.1 hypothetical protein SAMN03080606_03697 [Alkaliphilus peptidifermentans DSM 18978]
MKSKYIILGIMLVVCSSLFLVGCNREENNEISYEIITFENAPKEVQDEINKVDKRIRGSVINNDHKETISSSGNIDLGKERYAYFIINNEIPKIIEVGPDKAYGYGMWIKYTSEETENVEFPTNVTIVKLSDYYDRISHIYISHP